MQHEQQRRLATIKKDTFASVIRAYLCSPKFEQLEPSTRAGYYRVFRVAERADVLGAISTDVIRSSQVQAFLDSYADRPAAQYQALAAIKAVEKWAIPRDLLPWPITIGCEAPGGDGGYEPWTDEQVRLAELHAKPMLARAVTLGSNTGQRGSDLVKMRWSDLETYDGRAGINVVQKKTGLKIWIPMTQELMQTIGGWEKRPGFILLKETGQPWTREQLSDAWTSERDKNLALAPLKETGCVIHGLRATACVRLLRAGAHTRQIADMVGMSEQMVKKYVRFAVQRDNAIAAVHHLDRTHVERSKKYRARTGN
jgi:integrase